VKKIILFLIILIFIPFFSYPETILLKNGKTIEAEIIEKTDVYIKVGYYGVPLTYYLDEIESIDGNVISTMTPFISKTTFSQPKKEPTQIFKNISPAIVYITNKTVAKEEYIGSGFIFDKEGIIVTNFHVTKGAKELSVKLKNGEVYPVVGIINYDHTLDICILKINASNLPTVFVGDSNSMQIGETLYCIGNPLGLEYSFSNGMLSAVREINDIKYLQFTAPISPGNSGGPLVNSQGQVIGVVTFLMEGGQNLNFAIAINEIKPFISNQIKMTFQDFVEKVSQADYYFTEGYKYFLQDDYSKAIEYYQKVIQIKPNNPDVYSNLGVSYSALGQYQQAIEYYQKAIQINSNYVNAYNNLSVVYCTLGQFQQAIEYGQKALHLDPDYALAYNNLGNAYNELGQYQQAIEYIKKAIELDPNLADAYYNLAISYNSLGQFQQAIEYYQKTIQINPNHTLVYNNLSITYFALGQSQQAIEYCQKAIQLDPNHANAYAILGTVYYSLGRYPEAKENLLKAKELSQTQKNYEALKAIEETLNKIP